MDLNAKVFIHKIVYQTHVVNFLECRSAWTQWIALYVNSNIVTYLVLKFYIDSFGVKHIPEEIKTFIDNKNIRIDILGIYRPMII